MIKPKTCLGKWSIGLILSFFLFLTLFFILVKFGERGGQTFFSNLKLTIPVLIASFSAIGSFITGFVSIMKKERSVLVFLTSLIGFLVLLWIITELLFPH